MENQDKPRREWKGFLLLPLLALGIGILFTTRKPPPPQKSSVLTPQMIEADAYDHAKEQVMHRAMEGPLGASLGISFAPYTQGVVTPLGQGRFRCSSFLEARLRNGRRMRGYWHCILWQSHGYWMCDDLQQTQWKPVLPGPARRK